MKNVFKALKLISKIEPRLLPVTVLNFIFENAPFYIEILLSAFVLDSLTAGKAMGEIIPTVLWALLIWVLCKAAGEITQQIVWTREDHMGSLFLALRNEKTLSMDYESLNSPLVTELRDRMMRDDMYGWGLVGCYGAFSLLLANVMNLAASAAIAAAMLSFGWESAVYVVLTTALIVITAVLNGKFMKKEQETEDSYQNVRSYSSFYLWGGELDYKMGKDIRIYKAQPMIEKAVEEDKEERTGRRKFVRIQCGSAVFNSLSTTVLQGSSYIYVLLCAVKGAVSVGTAVKYASALYRFWGAAASVFKNYSELLLLGKRLDDTLKFLEIESADEGRELTKSDEYEVEFKNVSFTYPGSGKKALDNVSCKLRTGEKTAVVGLNGSGKTTFIKLLCRLYHPSDGEILLNGVNIEKYSFEEYVKLISVVFQDFNLFSFTLDENVSADENGDSKRVREVLETAGFKERLDSLEKAGQTVLYKNFYNDGIDISGGEAQKIALARALYKNAPFMILDEPTAALDPIAEYEIYSRFNSFTGGKCAVYISHRLSSCVFCDRVLVFKDGEIAERGTHKELLEKKGLYYRMWEAQAEYYRKK